MPYALAFVTKMKKFYTNYVIELADLYVLQENSNKYQNVVDLEKWECSCRQFQDMALPCSHAMVAIDYRQVDMHSYIEPWCESFTYQVTYLDRAMPPQDQNVMAVTV